MKPFLAKSIQWFSAIMSLFYAVLGIFLIVGDSQSILPYPYNILMGVFLIVYGIYRVYRLFRKED
jgi:uncharacterized membrane protein HdeD (DUF308 family)